MTGRYTTHMRPRPEVDTSVAVPLDVKLMHMAASLMFVGAILLSRNRPKMTIAVGISMVLGALVIRLALTLGQNQISYALQDTPFALAERAFFAIFTVFLVDGGRALFVLGLILGAVRRDKENYDAVHNFVS